MAITPVVLEDTGIYKLKPIKQTAVRRSVIKTKAIIRLNSATGKNGDETFSQH